MFLSPQADSRQCLLGHFPFLVFNAANCSTPAWSPRSLLPTFLFSLPTCVPYLFITFSLCPTPATSFTRARLCHLLMDVSMGASVTASGFGISHLPGKRLQARFQISAQVPPPSGGLRCSPQASLLAPPQHLAHQRLPRSWAALCPQEVGP